MFFFLSKGLCSEQVYRTSFLGVKPTNFNESNYVKKVDKRIGSKNYECYTSFPKEPVPDEEALERMKLELNESCFSFTHTRYWFFEFCPFKKLIQYRYANDLKTKIDNFYLGGENGNDFEPTKNGIAYDWNNGDKCYVTKKPRHVRIEYVCDQSMDDEGIVTSISEPDYCEYLIRFNTQYACGFKHIEKESVSDIECYEKKVEKIAKEKEDEKEEKITEKEKDTKTGEITKEME